MSRMFPFITKTWNPIGGECLHNCSYCWAKKLSKVYNMKKYTGKPTLSDKEMSRVFQHQDFVFTCDMTDLFGHWVPSEIIQRVLDRMLTSQAKFLLLTKNPSRYLEFDLPKNCVAGATIESDIDFELTGPPQMLRIEAMRKLKHPKMVSVEPIMFFGNDFPYKVASIHPDFIAVGYDNYSNGLKEPCLSDTEALIGVCEDFGIKVYRKTLRESIHYCENKEHPKSQSLTSDLSDRVSDNKEV